MFTMNGVGVWECICCHVQDQGAFATWSTPFTPKKGVSVRDLDGMAWDVMRWPWDGLTLTAHYLTNHTNSCFGGGLAVITWQLVFFSALKQCTPSQSLPQFFIVALIKSDCRYKFSFRCTQTVFGCGYSLHHNILLWPPVNLTENQATCSRDCEPPDGIERS